MNRKDTVLLAHCYQPGFIQDMADFVGDSFQLARTAAERPEKNILFAGVKFMAETAAILAPDSDVYHVAESSGCPMADMITPEKLREFQKKHPGSPTMCYVNSTAAVKALSDVCCTSSSAITIARKMDPSVPILFVPDKHLGQFTAEQSGREIICWDGFCNVHVRLKAVTISEAREACPEGIVMVHPECVKEVRDSADHVLSTGGMVKLARDKSGETFLVGTEIGLIHTLRKTNPENNYLPLSIDLVCPNMKMSTKADIEAILNDRRSPLKVPDDVAVGAREALERMLEMGS